MRIVSTVRRVLAGESVLHPELVLQVLRQFSGEPRHDDQGQLTRREQDVLRLMVLRPDQSRHRGNAQSDSQYGRYRLSQDSAGHPSRHRWLDIWVGFEAC
jgi:hypothetical protein